MKYLELTKSIKLALMSTFILGIVSIIQENYMGFSGYLFAFLLILKISSQQKALRLASEEVKRKKTIIEKLIALTGVYN